MGALHTTTECCALRALQAIYVPADDLTDPAPATTFAHLDATTVLSRSIAELGIYPAVDPLDSTSRMLNARILGQEHYDIARGVQRVLQVQPKPSTLNAPSAEGAPWHAARPGVAASTLNPKCPICEESLACTATHRRTVPAVSAASSSFNTFFVLGCGDCACA